MPPYAVANGRVNAREAVLLCYDQGQCLTRSVVNQIKSTRRSELRWQMRFFELTVFPMLRGLRTRCSTLSGKP